MNLRKMRGFSLVELMCTVTIILIVTGVATMAIQQMLMSAHVNSAYNTTLISIRQARDLAVAQRQQYSVTFNSVAVPNSIVITQTGNGNVVDTYLLPVDVAFSAVAGLPGAPNTPDGFGAGGTAIDFDQGIVGGAKNVIYFLPDGTGQDVAGNINNGVIYVALNNGQNVQKLLYSSHAITVWGATGRIRGWRLFTNPVGGLPAWRQN
jgi:prepilin-type N-terminal cleavage/methylation domain-containing protein